MDFEGKQLFYDHYDVVNKCRRSFQNGVIVGALAVAAALGLLVAIGIIFDI